MSFFYEISRIPTLAVPNPDVVRGSAEDKQQARVLLAEEMTRQGVERSSAQVLSSLVESTWTDDPDNAITARIVAEL